MEGNPIDAVRAAERRADDVLHEAAQESVRIRDAAYAEAARAGAAAQADATAAAAQMLAVAREKSGRMLQEADAAAAEDVQALHRQADQRRSAAVQAVISLLIDG